MLLFKYLLGTWVIKYYKLILISGMFLLASGYSAWLILRSFKILNLWVFMGGLVFVAIAIVSAGYLTRELLKKEKN